jgi:hypothetical protein
VSVPSTTLARLLENTAKCAKSWNSTNARTYDPARTNIQQGSTSGAHHAARSMRGSTPSEASHSAHVSSVLHTPCQLCGCA